LYTVRWQAPAPQGAPPRELSGLDATAGGPQGGGAAACLDLDSGQVAALPPADARARSDWHLCFRRAGVSVNGGLSGPRGVTACDVHGGESAGETLASVRARTAASEEERFRAVDASAKLACAPRTDGVASALDDAWVDRTASPPAPQPGAWLLRGADGVAHYLVTFAALDGATDRTPGAVSLVFKPVRPRSSP
jgi:hypothetical protein